MLDLSKHYEHRRNTATRRTILESVSVCNTNSPQADAATVLKSMVEAQGSTVQEITIEIKYMLIGPGN